MKEVRKCKVCKRQVRHAGLKMCNGCFEGLRGMQDMIHRLGYDIEINFEKGDGWTVTTSQENRTFTSYRNDLESALISSLEGLRE